MVRVYFESNSHAELVATFETEELYNQCLPILEAEAKKQRMIVTETIDESFDVKDKSIEPETYIDSGHAEGTFEYSRSEAITKIKEIAKQDSEFNWDIYNMSEDDVLEIGHNHYSINLK